MHELTQTYMYTSHTTRKHTHTHTGTHKNEFWEKAYREILDVAADQEKLVFLFD